MRPVSLLAALSLTCLTACSTTQTTLNYQPSQPPATAMGSAIFGIGRFDDQRGTDPHWLGAIRGGFGQPLKTIELQDSASDVVANAYRQALAAQGLLASSSPRYLVGGRIIHLDCSQLARREAHADIDVVVTDTRTGQPVFEQLFEKKIVQGDVVTFNVGIFASVNDLKAVATQALNQAIDASLGNDGFQRLIAAAKNPTEQTR